MTTLYTTAPGIVAGHLNTAGSMLGIQVNYPNPVSVSWASAYTALYNDVVVPCSNTLMYQDSSGIFHFLAPGSYLCRLYYQFQGANASAGLIATVYVNGAPYCVPFQGSLTNCYAGTYVTPQMFFMVHVFSVVPTTMFISFTCSNTSLTSTIPGTGPASTYSTINYYS